MTLKPRKADPARQAQLRAELKRDQDLRQAGYRERALAVLPHVCACCAREFSGKRLRELTVHHKDHNFRNNPPDGSNWELLCLYCHDHEHEKHLGARAAAGGGGITPATPSIANPFAALDALLPAVDEPAAQPD
jgi:hypothetical protein